MFRRLERKIALIARIILKDVHLRFDEVEAQVDARFDTIEAKIDALETVNSQFTPALQSPKSEKRELIIVFLTDNREYLDEQKYSSRALAAILSDVLDDTVSHTYANRVRKGMQ